MMGRQPIIKTLNEFVADQVNEATLP